MLIATYRIEEYYDGSEVSVCYTAADTLWSAFYFLASITIFFIIPFVILVLLYAAIAYKLLRRGLAFQRPISPPPPQLQQQQEPPSQSATDDEASAVSSSRRHTKLSHSRSIHSRQRNNRNQSLHGSGMRKHRKQVIFMLVAVVASFFLCHLPFRAFTLWVIVSAPDDIAKLGVDGYYNLLYFCRIMFYLNSSLNPILYNLMSSKFRKGFWQLIVSCCGGDGRGDTDNNRHINRSKRTRNVMDSRTMNIRHTPQHTLRRDPTALVSSMSTSSSTDRTSWRSGSLTTSTSTTATTMQKRAFPHERRSSVGAAIIGMTSSTISSACRYDNGQQ